jgi:hypothetical protein
VFLVIDITLKQTGSVSPLRKDYTDPVGKKFPPSLGSLTFAELWRASPSTS